MKIIRRNVIDKKCNNCLKRSHCKFFIPSHGLRHFFLIDMKSLKIVDILCFLPPVFVIFES